MPCLAIHLAVAKKYLEKHSNENHDDFILGTIAPDIELDNIHELIKGITDTKNGRHFGIKTQTNDIIEYMKRKVDFNLFFKFNDINTSFLRAYFLHLICDYYFFGEYITNKKLANLSFMDAVKMGYDDYDILTPKLIMKYNIEVPLLVEDVLKRKKEGELQLLDEDTIYNFIDEMANINLDEEKNKLLNSKN